MTSFGRVSCLCLYCGKTWERPAIFDLEDPVCEKCGETQSIKVSKKPGTGNVYGYDDEEKPRTVYGYNED